jgi:NitT/TauT family transport system ATP-binding protein
MAEIVLDNISKRFDDGYEAVKDMSLDVKDGEFMILVGPSGCGKSTLLEVVAGLEPATAGTVTVRGESVLMPQRDLLLPWRSALDNAALAPQLAGVARAEARRRAAALFARFGLEEFARARPAELSGGMRQRVAIARALSIRPKLLLMDEPFGALDALTRERMNLELQRIALATEATVVFVTHDITEAVFLGDRVVHLTPRPGRIRQIRTVDFARPRNIDLETEPEFGAIVRELRHALDEED